MAYGDAPTGALPGMMGGESEEASPPSSPMPESYASDELAALAEAMPELANKPERLEAFKTAIQICIDRALEKGDSGSEPPPPMKGKGGSVKAPSALVLAFGKPKGSGKG